MLGEYRVQLKSICHIALICILGLAAGCTVSLPLPTPTATPIPPTDTPAAPTATPTETPTPLPPTPTPQPADLLLSAMTLEEKVGQLFMVYSTGPTVDADLQAAIVEDHVGGVILFAPNVESPAQVAELINAAQAAATTSGAGVPLLVAVDQEGGLIARLWEEGFTQFPAPMAVGATANPDDARLVAAAMARELHALGFNMNLAPVLDVNSNPLNPVIGTRAFGGTAEQVIEMGLPVIETYRQYGIIATAKHFPGHGDTDVDSHHGLPVVSHDLDRLWAVELAPFQAAIDAGVDVIMTAHVAFPAVDPSGTPATLSPAVLDGLLRQQMGFEGIIATDSLGMDALSAVYGPEEAAARAFQAGADLLMFGKDPGHTPAEVRAAYARVLAMVRGGTISMERLDASVRRILLLKQRYGLLDWQPVDPMAAEFECGAPENSRAALDVALDGLTLVMNDNTLPLSPDQSVMLIVPQRAEGLADVLAAQFPHLDVVVLGLDPTLGQVAATVARSVAADVVVAATWDAHWHPGQVNLIKALAARPLVVVALNSPYDLTAFQAEGATPSAYLCAYSDATPSIEAVAQVLAGEAEAGGHLPVALGETYPIGYRWEAP
ncbi:MAG: beta-N-acetylhexosaminidase [Anaerolineae bacterium]|nr:beta-N-acetylhexosaminidase [Anaerolineae bacterium]